MTRQRCMICASPELKAINAALQKGESQNSIVLRFALATKTLTRHLTHLGVGGTVDTVSASELRKLKSRVEKSLNRIEGGTADDIERKQQAALLREHRQITEKLGALAGEINSKTVSALLQRLGVKSEAELEEMVEDRRKLSDITLEDLARDAVAGLQLAFEQRPELRAEVREVLFPVAVEPEMEV